MLCGEELGASPLRPRPLWLWKLSYGLPRGAHGPYVGVGVEALSCGSPLFPPAAQNETPGLLFAEYFLVLLNLEHPRLLHLPTVSDLALMSRSTKLYSTHLREPPLIGDFPRSPAAADTRTGLDCGVVSAGGPPPPSSGLERVGSGVGVAKAQVPTWAACGSVPFHFSTGVNAISPGLQQRGSVRAEHGDAGADSSVNGVRYPTEDADYTKQKRPQHIYYAGIVHPCCAGVGGRTIVAFNAATRAIAAGVRVVAVVVVVVVSVVAIVEEAACKV